jgi:hypothetical protein
MSGDKAAPQRYRPEPNTHHKCPYCNETARLRDVDVVVDSYQNVCHYKCLVKAAPVADPAPAAPKKVLVIDDSRTNVVAAALGRAMEAQGERCPKCGSDDCSVAFDKCPSGQWAAWHFPKFVVCHYKSTPHTRDTHGTGFPCTRVQPWHNAPATAAPSEERHSDAWWAKVHALLASWQEIWQADKAKFTDSHPKWMVEAAEELFAHDMCDAWDWNDYVKAALVIIERHYANAGHPSQGEGQ